MIVPVAALFIGLVLVVFCTAGFRRCSEDQILVVCGMEANRKDFKCVHGGGTFLWPLIQGDGYSDPEPMTISISQTDVMTSLKTPVSMHAGFTVRVSSEHGVMENAAAFL